MLRYLALGLGNAVNLLDPARIVLDRRLELCGEPFLDQLRRAIRMRALSHIAGDLVDCYGALREEAGVLGDFWRDFFGRDFAGEIETIADWRRAARRGWGFACYGL
jgi:hypothetical protein